MKDAIHHIDGNPLNNDLSNLRRVPIASSVEDMDHRAADRIQAAARSYHILVAICDGATPGTRGWEKLMINIRDTIRQFEGMS